MQYRVLVAYAMPVLATQFVYVSFTTVLPGIYVKYFGLSAASLAWALLASRVFDAVSDPLIGYFSDSTRSRLGRRKPWIVMGSLITAVGIWQITQPDMSGNVAWHFTGWAIVFYLGWTMMEIPHTAWGSEIDTAYDGRNRVFFLRTIFSIIGPLAFAALPLLLAAPTTEMTPQVMSAVALVFVLMAPLCVAASVLFVPSVPNLETSRQVNPGIVAACRAIGGNALFWRLLLVFVIGGLAAGINGTLQFIYLDTYLNIGDKLAYAIGAMMLSALLGLPIWLLVMKFLDKSKAWSISLFLASIWVAAPALLDPGQDAFIPFLIMAVGLALSSGAGAMVPFSLLGDVIDFDEYKTGYNRSGAYFSVFLFGVKLNAAIGGSVAFGLLAFFEYDAAATENSSIAVQGLKLTYALIPASLFALSASLVYFFPLTRKRHGIVRRALDRRSRLTVA